MNMCLNISTNKCRLQLKTEEHNNIVFLRILDLRYRFNVHTNGQKHEQVQDPCLFQAKNNRLA